MKQIFTILVALLATTNLWAYDFHYGELCYNITSNTTVEVTYQDWSYNYDGLITATIPETVTYEGTTYSVTSIGDWAFFGCSSLTSVTIPNSVTSIGNSAFSDCYALTSVTIPNSVTSIGDYAFSGCSALTSIVVESGNSTYDSRNNCNAIIETATNTLIAGCKNTVIPNSVTSIGDYAFSWCSALTSITIPNSVTSIGYDAFSGCTFTKDNFINHSTLDTEANNYWGATIIIGSEINGLFIRNDTIIDCRENVTSAEIPNSVTSIGERAFYGCYALTSITIPNSVTSIGWAAFEECSSLTSVTIGNSVKRIRDWAFSGCSALTSIVVESGNSTYDSRDNCNAIIETATNTLIAGCKNTVIPNSVTSIGEMAFRECSSLTSITIPNSVTSIGDGAFYSCRSLTSVTIPNSVTSIGEEAFHYCSALTSVTIGNSVTSIGEMAFEGCSVLTSVTIGNSVTSIGDYAFVWCSSLTSVTIPNSVTSIGEGAFGSCESLTSISIPNSVTSIGDYAFSGCSALSSIVVESGNSNYDSRENCNAIIETATNTLVAGCQNTIIPNSVTSIGEGAFVDCYALTSVTIPNSVTSIEEEAFGGCDALTSIAIPNSVTSIGNGAFFLCESLTSITIPNSVTSIGNSAFSDCYALKTVICEAIEVPELGSSVFYYMPLSEATLYVPAQSLDDYKAAEQWKEFGTILPIKETSTGVENIYNTSSTADTNKLIRDGQLIIVRGGKSYSVMGQEL